MVVAQCRSRAEAANLRYDPWRDQVDHARFLLEGLYTDAQGRRRPSPNAAFSGLLAAIPGLAESSAFVLDPRDIA